jgi:hypothetical protein
MEEQICDMRGERNATRLKPRNDDNIGIKMRLRIALFSYRLLSDSAIAILYSY